MTEEEIRERETCLSQGTLRTVGSHQKLGEKHEIDSPAEPPEGTDTANIFISDFCPRKQ